MALNISIDEKNIKYYIIGIIIAIMTVSIIGALIVNNRNNNQRWANNKPQTFEQIKDVKVAMPYVTKSYSIMYLKDKDIFVVEYAGYQTKESIEVKIVSWFKNYSDYKSVRVRYSGSDNTIYTYDLTKDITETLRDNKLINPPNMDKSSFGKS